MPRTPRRLLALLSALAGLALATPASAHAADCANVDLVPDAANLAQVSQATVCLLNNERLARGLAPVAQVDGLSRPSLAYSARMVAEGFFAHESPDGGTLTDRLVTANYIEREGSWTVGENIAWGQGHLATPRSITVAWMNSPGHKANILTAGYDEIGIGVVLGTPGDTSWGATYTTDFGNVERDGANTAASAVKGARAARTAKTAKTAKRCSRGRAAAARGAKAKGAKAKRLRTCAKAASTRRSSRA